MLCQPYSKFYIVILPISTLRTVFFHSVIHLKICVIPDWFPFAVRLILPTTYLFLPTIIGGRHSLCSLFWEGFATHSLSKHSVLKNWAQMLDLYEVITSHLFLQFFLFLFSTVTHERSLFLINWLHRSCVSNIAYSLISTKTAWHFQSFV